MRIVNENPGEIDIVAIGPLTNIAEALRRAEAVLFAAGEPLSAEQVAEILPQGVDAATILMSLKAAYANRGVNLVEEDPEDPEAGLELVHYYIKE